MWGYTNVLAETLATVRRMPLRPARYVVAACIIAVAVAAAGRACAASLSLQDCVEGSDFIANAARARDNGMSREAFIERLEADLAAIRSLPPALRWFVRGENDERLLRESVRRVYDRPLAPERHREAFLVKCLDHVDVGTTTKNEEVESKALVGIAPRWLNNTFNRPVARSREHSSAWIRARVLVRYPFSDSPAEAH